jgi:hypothetical protein
MRRLETAALHAARRLEVVGFQFDRLTVITLERTPGGVLDLHASSFEGGKKVMRRRTAVAEVIVERIEGNTAPDFTVIHPGLECDTRCRYDMTSSAELNRHPHHLLTFVGNTQNALIAGDANTLRNDDAPDSPRPAPCVARTV